MTQFSEALRFLIERSGMNRAEICRRVIFNRGYITETSLSKAYNGKGTLDPKTILLLSPVLKLTEEETNRLIMLAYAVRSKNETVKERFDDISQKIEGNGTLLANPKPGTECPVWSNIKAGPADLSVSNADVVEESEMTDSEIRRGCFCILVTGDALEGEKINSGDIAHFQPLQAGGMITDRDICAVNVEGEQNWRITKIKKLPGGRLILVSANPKYPSIEIDTAKARITIKGTLLRIVRNYSKSFNI